jgi:hypothetical protein
MSIELHETSDPEGGPSRPFRCPTCRKPAEVVPKPLRPPGSSHPVTAPFWLLTRCSGFCGLVSRKRNQAVELIPDPVLTGTPCPTQP